VWFIRIAHFFEFFVVRCTLHTQLIGGEQSASIKGHRDSWPFV